MTLKRMSMPDRAKTGRSTPDSDRRADEIGAARPASPDKNSLVPSATGIRRAAMDRLARREHCRRELEEKLVRQFPEATAAIGLVLDELEHGGLLCDARFRESFVQGRVRRGYGPRRIAAELGRHGLEIPSDNSVDWLARARELRARRFGEALPADPLSRNRQMAFLQRRGFPASLCREACLPSRDD